MFSGATFVSKVLLSSSNVWGGLTNETDAISTGVAETVTAQDALIFGRLCSYTLTVLVPGFKALTLPFPSTVATSALELLQAKI